MSAPALEACRWIIDTLKQGKWWISEVDGDWADPTNWSTGIVPGMGETAIVQRPLVPVVTHSSNTHQIGAICCAPAYPAGMPSTMPGITPIRP